MSKKIIFISHISEEQELAVLVKEMIEESFLGIVDVFVSSDFNSVKLGQKWLDSITDSLKSCIIELVICSPQSVQKPWINFEAGAGWVRGIPVVPLCHSGIKPEQLPLPLNLLQAASINNISSVKLLLPLIAESLESKTPKINFDDFIKKVIEFEKKYTYWSKVNEAFLHLVKGFPDFIQNLETKGNYNAKGVKSQFQPIIESISNFLLQQKILGYRNSGSGMGIGGSFLDYEFYKLEEFDKIILDDNFKFKSQK